MILITGVWKRNRIVSKVEFDRHGKVLGDSERLDMI